MMKRSNKILGALVIGSLLTGYSAFAETDLTVKYDSDSETLPSITLKKGTTIKNVADGLVGEGSNEAVNGNQLYKLQKSLNDIGDGMVENALNISAINSYNTEQDLKISDATTNANKALQLVKRGYDFTINGKTAVSFDPDNHYMNFQEGDNVSIEAYTSGSGVLETKGLKFSVKADGKVEAGNTGLVTGGMVKEAINLATEGIATDVNVENKADKDLSNLSDGGKSVIAKAAATAASEAATTAAANAVIDKANKDASNINVADWSSALGTTIIEENGAGLITSGTLFTAINDLSDDVTDMLDDMSLQFAMDDASNIGTNLRKAKDDGGYEEATYTEKQINLNGWGKAIGTGAVEESNGQLVTGGTVYTALSGYAKKDASNIEVATWQEALGTGANVSGNTGLITGDTLNKALANYSGGMSYSGSDTIAISDTGNISVITNGKVENNNGGLVTGGQVSEAIKKATEGIASDATIAAKADKSYVDTELTKKADANNVYTKEEADKKISSAVDGVNTSISAKADKSYVDTELAKKVNTSDFNDVKSQVEQNVKDIAAKADKSYVDTELAKKADANNVYTKEEADKKIESAVTGVNTSIAAKADKSYVDTELTKKADQSAVNELSSKVTANESSISDLKSATNIDVTAYTEKLGVGQVADGNTGLITGGAVYQVVNELKDNTGLGLVTVTEGTVTVAKDSEATKVDFSGKDGARVVTGVVTDANDVYSAANVGYVNEQAKALESGMNAMNAKLTDDIKNAGAVGAALAGLHHLDYDPDNKLDVAASIGHYRGKNAGALGVFYQPNENVMISAGATVGADDNAYNAGVSFKIGKGSSYGSTSKAAMAAEIRKLKENNENQASEIKELKEQMAMLMQKMELSTNVEKSIAK